MIVILRVTPNVKYKSGGDLKRLKLTFRRDGACSRLLAGHSVSSNIHRTLHLPSTLQRCNFLLFWSHAFPVTRQAIFFYNCGTICDGVREREIRNLKREKIDALTRDDTIELILCDFFSTLIDPYQWKISIYFFFTCNASLAARTISFVSTRVRGYDRSWKRILSFRPYIRIDLSNGSTSRSTRARFPSCRIMYLYPRSISSSLRYFRLARNQSLAEKFFHSSDKR